LIYFGFVSLCYKVYPSLLIKVGNEGPYISESKTPTLKPIFFKLAATLIAIVLFPTPPLQLDTAIIFFIRLKLAFLDPFYFSCLDSILISTSKNPALSKASFKLFFIFI
jgi:hypothetical protein